MLCTRIPTKSRTFSAVLLCEPSCWDDLENTVQWHHERHMAFWLAVLQIHTKQSFYCRHLSLLSNSLLQGFLTIFVLFSFCPVKATYVLLNLMSQSVTKYYPFCVKKVQNSFFLFSLGQFTCKRASRRRCYRPKFSHFRWISCRSMSIFWGEGGFDCC